MAQVVEACESGFDAAAFCERLRLVAVEDQKKMDSRYVWKDGGKEHSGYPESSDQCLRLVAEALQENPDASYQILNAVDRFLDESKGSDRVQLVGAIERPNDLMKLFLASNGKAVFYRRLSALMMQQPSEQVRQNVPDAGTADAVNRLIA